MASQAYAIGLPIRADPADAGTAHAAGITVATRLASNRYRITAIIAARRPRSDDSA